jgi:hypothetical protein
MGIIGNILKIALIGACLYGVYQCNRSMTEARERRAQQSSQLELKIENEEITAVRDSGNNAIYGSRLQESYSQCCL